MQFEQTEVCSSSKQRFVGRANRGLEFEQTEVCSSSKPRFAVRANRGLQFEQTEVCSSSKQRFAVRVYRGLKFESGRWCFAFRSCGSDALAAYIYIYLAAYIYIFPSCIYFFCVLWSFLVVASVWLNNGEEESKAKRCVICAKCIPYNGDKQRVREHAIIYRNSYRHNVKDTEIVTGIMYNIQK